MTKLEVRHVKLTDLLTGDDFRLINEVGKLIQ